MFPKPFEAELLMLSPLGGWLRSRGAWTPPYQVLRRRLADRPDLREIFRLAARTPSRCPRRDGIRRRCERPLGGLVLQPFERIGERLDLSEWVHVAAQGRDHYVRIVYEGELKPFRNAAALIKVTERKFEEQGPIVGAYLRQRMFIVVREPVKTFSEDDRAMPYKKVRLTTLVTPDIAYPEVIPGTERSFWVEVKTSATTEARFMFHGVGTDIAGNETDFTVPMMFVSRRETEETLPIALAEYNRSAIGGRPRGPRAPHPRPGTRVRAARPGSGEAQHAARHRGAQLRARGERRPGAAQGGRQGPAGPGAPRHRRGDDDPAVQGYVDGGFDAATGVFAEIAKPKLPMPAPTALDGMEADTLGVDFSSDKAGGFATPNLGVSTLTRSLGPLAGKAADAVTDTFDPASFFGGGLAKLFGSFDLADMLPTSTLGKNAPKLRTTSSDIPGGKLVVTTLDWEPEVENKDLAVVEFVKDHNGTTELKVHGVITKPVVLTGTPDPPTFEFTGTLNDFRIGVLKSVFVNFVLFSFTAKSEQKPDVKVQLDPAVPVEFAGDLEFVEELRKAIPPDLFGDGPEPRHRADRDPRRLRDRPAAGRGRRLRAEGRQPRRRPDAAVHRRQAGVRLQRLRRASSRSCCRSSIFGGGGFFRLQLDTAGMKELEAALEFGVTASLDIGVASGSVHMMAGIYFALERQDPSNDLAATLSGYLRIGGSMSVLGIITVSVEFNLSFTYDAATEKAYGRATLTVEVEVLFFSASVELTVERAFGGQGGDPKFVEMFTSAPVWKEYAQAFA